MRVKNLNRSEPRNSQQLNIKDKALFIILLNNGSDN